MGWEKTMPPAVKRTFMILLPAPVAMFWMLKVPPVVETDPPKGRFLVPAAALTVLLMILLLVKTNKLERMPLVVSRVAVSCSVPPFIFNGPLPSVAVLAMDRIPDEMVVVP